MVVDATQLVRNLYLVVQILELGVPVVLALNMIDEAGEAAPDPQALGALLGVPCVATNARLGGGIEDLERVVARALTESAVARPRIEYAPELLADARRVAEALPQQWLVGCTDEARRTALALWALTSVHEDDELVDIPTSLRVRVAEVGRALAVVILMRK